MQNTCRSFFLISHRNDRKCRFTFGNESPKIRSQNLTISSISNLPFHLSLYIQNKKKSTWNLSIRKTSSAREREKNKRNRAGKTFKPLRVGRHQCGFLGSVLLVREKYFKLKNINFNKFTIILCECVLLRGERVAFGWYFLVGSLSFHSATTKLLFSP